VYAILLSSVYIDNEFTQGMTTSFAKVTSKSVAFSAFRADGLQFPTTAVAEFGIHVVFKLATWAFHL
jgi:hypothetical protein